jgi:Putative MetA-pathway of phenol degradation
VVDYFRDWFTRVSKTQAEQPHWVTPLVTVTPRLEEELRYDQIWQNRPHGQTLDSFGGGKGLELIPTENTEVILGIPAWQVRNTPSGTDGFADETLLLKYRLLAANEEQGNYIVTLFAGFTLPTGSKHNTDDHAIFTPTIAFGKGWGDFDVQATLGASVPDNAVGNLGTPILANAAFQYRLAKVFWPEVEVNYTYWPNGERQGIHQVYITTGLVIGRIPLWERLGVTVGAGFQIAVTERPVYHNASILSVRLPF